MQTGVLHLRSPLTCALSGLALMVTRRRGWQAHQAAVRAAKAEMDALLEARSASEQAYIDRAIAASEESQTALQEQRTADAEEFKAMKSRRAGL